MLHLLIAAVDCVLEVIARALVDIWELFFLHLVEVCGANALNWFIDGTFVVSPIFFVADGVQPRVHR